MYIEWWFGMRAAADRQCTWNEIDVRMRRVTTKKKIATSSEMEWNEKKKRNAREKRKKRMMNYGVASIWIGTRDCTYIDVYIYSVHTYMYAGSQRCQDNCISIYRISMGLWLSEQKQNKIHMKYSVPMWRELQEQSVRMECMYIYMERRKDR